MWVCELCIQDLNKMDSVVCDCCLKWVHLKCTGKKETCPRASFGFADTAMPKYSGIAVLPFYLTMNKWICRDFYT